jgi:hypothetical protein
MVEAQYRVRRAIAVRGDTFTVGGVSHKALVFMISPGQARRYLSDAAIDAATRPIYSFVVADNDTTVASDTITFDGFSLAVLAIVRRRSRGNLVFKMIFAAV